MMTTWQHGREARDARVKAGEKLAKGKFVEARDATELARSCCATGRSRLPRRRQPEAGGSAVCRTSGCRPRQGEQSAHGAVRRGAAGASRPVRPRRGEEARLCLFGSAVGAHRDDAVRRQDRARRGPYLFGAVRPLLHRSHAERRADRSRQRGQGRQPLHRAEYRGHADRRGGDRLQGRSRRRAGERDRRQGAARRHTGRPGAVRRQGRQAVFRRAAVHARSRRHHRNTDPDRHAGDQGHLRALWRSGASTTASASAPPRSSCCCRHMARSLD